MASVRSLGRSPGTQKNWCLVHSPLGTPSTVPLHHSFPLCPLDAMLLKCVGSRAAAVCFSIGSQLPLSGCQCLLIIWVSAQGSPGDKHVQDSVMWGSLLLCSWTLGGIPMPSHSQTLREGPMASLPPSVKPLCHFAFQRFSQGLMENSTLLGNIWALTQKIQRPVVP